MSTSLIAFATSGNYFDVLWGNTCSGVALFSFWLPIGGAALILWWTIRRSRIARRELDALESLGEHGTD